MPDEVGTPETDAKPDAEPSKELQDAQRNLAAQKAANQQLTGEVGHLRDLLARPEAVTEPDTTDEELEKMSGAQFAASIKADILRTVDGRVAASEQRISMGESHRQIETCISKYDDFRDLIPEMQPISDANPTLTPEQCYHLVKAPKLMGQLKEQQVKEKSAEIASANEPTSMSSILASFSKVEGVDVAEHIAKKVLTGEIPTEDTFGEDL